MFKIQTLNKISSLGILRMSPDTYEIASEFSNPDAVLVRSFKMNDMEFNANLKVIGRAGAGVNNIPVSRCTDKGIVVFNTPGANANAVKELVLCGMFLASRKIVDGINWGKTLEDQGAEVTKIVEKNKEQFGGNEIKGKTLGLIGLGAIGTIVANDAIELGMNVLGYDPFISVDKAWQLSSKVKKAAGLDSLLANSDIISVHMPLTDDTKSILNREKFALMKKGVKIMNFSRSEIVNNNDLKVAIKDGIVGCYVTDFPSDDLLNVPGIICIPHLGASTQEAEDNCAVMVVDQVMDFLENGNIINSVNFPTCYLERSTGGSRLVISNKNIPAMVGQISTILADAKFNIIEMINKSRNEIAYTMVDVEGKVPEEVVSSLRSINGVISVRNI
ncbi:MAG: 3-phosphoglycerate dehydrogenase [Candidatus Margulisiibacteriota bacterium]|nr:MAG: 3-phosphoglycerate dehydrogenase [Candidatus Margulisbacteria bacterium GWD2_39_127]OGI04614.1 MAG: 3-phosphoglycerate dehydrogenase [Candidatus Margulisbacteria bacterium GWF2_38_17]OGI11854.1 MAG: 3-phosphoglycerate dehydrogenase [Candidatus Margulisbacteria bacterium GWE2_39_32]PZM79771.1 MAG: 3-phosphoglycerate dehydrogenase [Candidatus Margulisiibacteriota bacterium]HAR62676.1 3-phosphoglycerate dehydrogenase [Candidatus Margulisiibacteriota bacterium]